MSLKYLNLCPLFHERKTIGNQALIEFKTKVSQLKSN